MGLAKGQTNNPNGRPKGHSNRVTNKVKNSFCKLLDNNLDRLQADIDSLEPRERIKVLLSLAEYIIPKLQRQEALTVIQNMESPVKIYLPDNQRGRNNY